MNNNRMRRLMGGFLLMGVMATLQLTLAVDAKELIKSFDFDAYSADPKTAAVTYIKDEALKYGTFSRGAAITSVGPKVAIGGFQVIFQEKVYQKNEGRGLIGGAFTGNFQDNIWKLEVKNLSPETLQQITDAAYADLLANLTAAGYEVIPAKTLLENETYKAVVAESQAEANETSGLPTQRLDKFNAGLNLMNMAKGTGDNVQITVVPADLPILSVDGTFAPMGNGARLRKLGKVMDEVGGVSLVNAVYRLDTEKLTTTGSAAFVRGGEKDRTFGLSLTPGSNITFFPYAKKGQNPAEGRRYTLKKRIESLQPVGEGDFLSENYGTQVLTGVLKVMGAPAPSAARVRKYELTITPEQYVKVGQSLLEATNRMIREQVVVDRTAGGVSLPAIVAPAEDAVEKTTSSIGDKAAPTSHTGVVSPVSHDSLDVE